MGAIGNMLREFRFNAGTHSLNIATNDNHKPPLLLLHGLMRRWQYLMPLIQALNDQWCIFAMDLRGHGLSDHISNGYHLYQNYAPDVVAFVQTLTQQPVTLFGHSLGGLIALGAAAKAGTQVAKLIVAEVPLTPETILSTVQLGAWAWIPQVAGKSSNKIYHFLKAVDRHAPDSYLRETAEQLHHLDPQTVLYWAENRIQELLPYYDIDQTLSQITAPFFLIQANPALGGITVERDLALARQQVPHLVHIQLLNENHELGLDTGKIISLITALKKSLNSESSTNSSF